MIELSFTPWEFFTPSSADGLLLKFVWQQVSSSFLDFLSILAVVNNEVTWMVSTRPLISKFFSPFNNP